MCEKSDGWYTNQKHIMKLCAMCYINISTPYDVNASKAWYPKTVFHQQTDIYIYKKQYIYIYNLFLSPHM